MTKIKNKVVLITGGASGIGRLMAERCCTEGAHRVVLWDINEAALLDTARHLEDLGGHPHVQVVNVARPDDIYAAAEQTLAEVGAVDIVFNNAGIIVGKSFEAHTPADIQRTLDINVGGVMHVARAFLPAMIEQGAGHFVNIASAAGLLPNPNMTVYVGSKWAVVGWSESLRLELEALKGDFHVLTVMPGYIDTGMFDGVKAPLLAPLLAPEYIADKIIKAVKRNQVMLQEPFIVKAIPALRGLLPVRAFDFVADRLGVYHSMDTFKGRGEQQTTTPTTRSSKQ